MMWTMMLVYGRAQTDEGPGNGGIILFLTIPLAAILVSVGIIPFWNLIYRKLS
jgi:hypothetical protein